MSNTGPALSSDHSVPAQNRPQVVEPIVVVCLAAGLLLVSVPFVELLAVWIPQLTLLALYSGTLALLDTRLTGTARRALVAVAAALVFAAVGILFALSAGYDVLLGDNKLIFTLPYAIGAGIAGGTWVARPGTRFGGIFMRAFEGVAATLVLYGGLGIVSVALRS